ncbi:unnamed protein product [Merluccius merluccius]
MAGRGERKYHEEIKPGVSRSALEGGRGLSRNWRRDLPAAGLLQCEWGPSEWYRGPGAVYEVYRPLFTV